MVKKQIIFMAIISFILNNAWEMLQMPFFEEMNFTDLRVWLFCFVATLGDVFMILIIFIFGKRIFGSWTWIIPVKFSNILYLFLAGFSFALLTEVISLNLGLWRYSDQMPIIPLFNIGLIPVIQLQFLSFLSYFFAFKIAVGSQGYQNDSKLLKRSTQDA